MNRRLDELKKLVSRAPQKPGCYLWKDEAGNVLYVGKAKNLRARLRQYVNLEDSRPQIPRLMSEAYSFDYIVVSNNHEALVLEINLIQNYHPPFNVSLMDDKSYPFLALTMGDMFPALKYTREKHNKKTLYFGPYTNAHAARSALDIVRKVCPICVATCAEWKRCKKRLESSANTAFELERIKESGRPCFDYHVGKGPGVCVGNISQEAYAEHVELVKYMLKGRQKLLVQKLEQMRDEAAQELDFEKAGRYQARIDAISELETNQHVYVSKHVNADVVGLFSEVTISAAFVFVVREGRVIRTCEFILDKGTNVSKDEILQAFLTKYYANTADIPKTIEVPFELSDTEMFLEWLSNKAQSNVSIHVPKMGEKKALLDSATLNARHALMRYELKTGYEDKRINRALQELESALALERPPLRIESYDISTLHGTHTVASMVVFENGKPKTSGYRKFRIKQDLKEANDFASMEEVFTRRFSKHRREDTRFGSLPDLVVVDGGRPQLSVAKKVLDKLGVDVPIVGLAKADEEVIPTFQDAPIILPDGSASLYLMKEIRDEAHRFAITYHRELRTKAMKASVLDELEGVGPKRKRALLRAFGSAKKIKLASVEELADVPGISRSLAESIAKQLAFWTLVSNSDSSTLEVEETVEAIDGTS